MQQGLAVPLVAVISRSTVATRLAPGWMFAVYRSGRAGRGELQHGGLPAGPLADPRSAGPFGHHHRRLGEMEDCFENGALVPKLMVRVNPFDIAGPIAL